MTKKLSWAWQQGKPQVFLNGAIFRGLLPSHIWRKVQDKATGSMIITDKEMERD